MKKFKYNKSIDYTLLDPAATDDQIIELCNKAREFGVKSVCVLPTKVAISAKELDGSNVLVCTVVDFPGGTNSLDYKIKETYNVLKWGADEVDMVLNYSLLIKNGDKVDEDTMDLLIDEVSELVDICHSVKNKEGDPVLLKVIIESGVLTEEQTKIATEICDEADADYIKTSTGKAIGAEANKVKIMQDEINRLGSSMKIKVSGGIRTLAQIETFELLGASRFGVGCGAVDILNGLESENKGY